jgi:hypothetical protein
MNASSDLNQKKVRIEGFFRDGIYLPPNAPKQAVG